ARSLGAGHGELSAAMLADVLPATRGAMAAAANRFNEAFTYRWERVIEFLKLHYVLSRRRDSDYWRDHVAPGSMPERLRESLELSCSGRSLAARLDDALVQFRFGPRVQLDHGRGAGAVARDLDAHGRKLAFDLDRHAGVGQAQVGGAGGVGQHLEIRFFRRAL